MVRPRRILSRLRDQAVRVAMAAGRHPRSKIEAVCPAQGGSLHRSSLCCQVHATWHCAVKPGKIWVFWPPQNTMHVRCLPGCPPGSCPIKLPMSCSSEASEELRRLFLDTSRSYGYELVMPPLLEHLTLLTGTGESLDLQTFVGWTSCLAVRWVGVGGHHSAARTMPICSITRCRSPVFATALRCTRAERPHATREPLQFVGRIPGHAGQPT
jgi:hypothetical protein